MKLIAPDYYSEFRCIAGACRHSCCIGWEIDIDEETLCYYNSIGGDFGKRLSDSISAADTPHFILGGHERCPFLNSANLCDIILELGEDSLCQICSDHPRFRNFYDDRTEIGLGLCCEAAARLIIGHEDKVQLVTVEGCDEPFEDEFFLFRAKLFSIIQDRTLSVDERIDKMLRFADVPFPSLPLRRWAEIFGELEQLDPEWGSRLRMLENGNVSKSSLSDTASEQLLFYFIYRHLADGLYDGMLRERIAFAVLSVHIIRSLCSVCGDDVCEIARMYSSEIEYSEENIEALLSFLAKDIQ